MQPNESLKEYTTTEHDAKYSISRCPDEQYRKKEHEVHCAQYSAEHKIVRGSPHGKDKQLEENKLSNSRESGSESPHEHSEEYFDYAEALGEVRTPRLHRRCAGGEKLVARVLEARGGELTGGLHNQGADRPGHLRKGKSAQLRSQLTLLDSRCFWAN